jgi:hypothetical protein
MFPIDSPTPRYRYRVDGLFVAIEDLNGPVSVAEAAEQVLSEIRQEVGSLDGKYVVWRDAQGIWDGMEYQNDLLVFYPIAAEKYEEAKALLLSGGAGPGENWVVKEPDGQRRYYNRDTWTEFHPE